jgi:hypothetical protein
MEPDTTTSDAGAAKGTGMTADGGPTANVIASASASSANEYEDVIVASNAFEHEMKDKRAMIDSIADPTVLLPEYKDADSPGFLPGIQYLSTKYQMRRVRGDGNCFYRAFLFAYLEQVLMWHLEGDSTRKENARQEHDRIRSLIVNS